MSARPFELPAFELPATFARLWIDSSLQMVRATTELWTGLLGAAPARTSSSTASPWWMPPQTPSFAAPAATPWPAAFGIGAWAPAWPQAMALPALTAPAANPFFPWAASLPAASSANPFAMWQQIWLQAAAPSLPWPYQSAAAPASAAVWQPFAAAYRTANGHAIAAVLRTMADVVEPKPGSATPASFWPATLGTRH